MALYKLDVIHPRLEFVGVEILTTFWFYGIILAPDIYARKSIKSSKDSYDSLVSKKT